MEGSGARWIQIISDPDLEGPKTYGSGSGTLLKESSIPNPM